MEEEKPKKKRKKKAAAEGEGSKEHKKNWREVNATPEEIKAFLNDHVYLRYNLVKYRLEARLPSEDPFWQNSELAENLAAAFKGQASASAELAKVDQGGKAVVAWNAPATTGSTEGYAKVTIK